MNDSKASTLRELVDAARDRDRPRGVRRTPLQQIIREVGVSRAYFYEILNGRKVPSIDIIERIADVLQIEQRLVEEAILRGP